MAEVKNAFIKSKMNKDLDARLVPQGEYRDAQNAQISRSEGDDVGALTNVLGNKLLVEFDITQNGMTSIGYYVDEINNDIYVFITDNFTDGWIKEGAGGGNNHAIYRYNVRSEVSTKLVEGAFLNFSTKSPIIGVNLLEELLFWTDNRNQPRKINVKTAAADSTYYTAEDQISVAKYNPYEAITLYEASTASSGDYETTMKDVVSKFLPDGGTATISATATGTSFSITDLNIPFYPALQTSGTDNLPQNGMTLGKITSAGGPIVDTGVTVGAGSSTSTLVTSGSITLNANDVVVFNYNPYYDNGFAGDEDYLEDKFVRFSYRFKFDDGEYSLIAPFTQPCFIPKQDGYFLNTSTSEGDQQLAFNSTIVSFMENKVNEIKLIIPLPEGRNTVVDSFKIDSLEILYKESDQTALRVVESITDITSASTNAFYEYTYSGKQPFKTLPENEIIRVYDKIPVKAFSQEIINNRVVYGNFQNKHTPPSSLDYNIIATSKSDFNLKTGSAVFVGPSGTVTAGTTINISGATGTIQQGSIATATGIPANTIVTSTNGSSTIVLDKNITLVPGRGVNFSPANDIENTTSKIEYPSHSLKTNRNYQVGVVLSDKYGRSSSVILSDNNNIVTVGIDDFKGDSIYSPYEDGTTTPSSWPGNSLKMSFNSVIGPSQPNNATGWPGLYNNDITSDDYNPLGWYSFKIVVKQQEQEYYNVYTAGAMQGLPYNYDNESSIPTLNSNTSYTTLINDNINKVPRDLSEVGPQDRTFRSSVKLFGRVNNTSSSFINNGNEQYYPGQKNFTTNVVEDLFDIFDVKGFENTVGESQPITSNKNPFHPFFKSDSNPFIAEFVTSNVTSNQFGVINTEVNTTAGTANVNEPSGVSGETIITIDNISAGFAPEPDDIITGTAVAAGTKVISFDGAASEITVNLAQTLSDNTVLTFTRRTYEDIENLAILETEPTLSRLDIYYETSTSGLISELNTAVLNDSAAGSDFDGFNTGNFTEGLNSGQNILQANFFLVNNFGTNIAPGDVTSFTLDSVFTIPDEPGETAVDATSYFALTGDQTAGFNIQTTTEFLNHVYFQSESDLNNFVFNFTSVINSSTTPYVREALLNNEDPVMTAPVTTVSNKTIEDVLMTQATAVNGANTNNINQGLDIVWSITSQTNSAGEAVNYFGIDFQVTNNGDRSDCNVNNLLPGTIIPDIYTIVLQCIDAGQSADDVTITIDLGVTPTQVTEYRALVTEQGEQQAEQDVYITQIHIEDANDTNQNGYYIYNGGWNNSPGNNLSDSTSIIIDYTNAVKQNGDPCGTWYFSSTEQGARDLWENCYDPAIQSVQYVEPNNPDISGYFFGIV